jgi:hypothetical protein
VANTAKLASLRMISLPFIAELINGPRSDIEIDADPADV